MKKWQHDELQSDLAEYLRSKGDVMAWENMQVGPSGSPRPDVYAISKTYTRFCPVTYEIKVSVSDFRSDITSGKWQSYLKFSGAVIFAAPAGMVSKSDIPSGCGLIQRSDAGWRMTKAPTLQKIDSLDRDAWLKLLMGGIEREVGRNIVQARPSSHWRIEQKLRKRQGDDIARLIFRAINSREMLEEEISRRDRQREEIRLETRKELDHAIDFARQKAETLTREQYKLAQALGLPRDASASDLISAMRRATERLTRDNEVIRLRMAFSRIKDALAEGTLPLPTEASG